jgi:hypothetical protein
VSELTALYLEEDSWNMSTLPPESLPRILVAASATLPRTENTGVGDSESNRFDTLVLNVGLLTTLGSSPGLV